ncbi:MAG: efflux RND transporter periplasmic adaptor subunit [Elusimicrobia bacterium]|nr:efflux RND transporter periplasmic adaptor subunit [Elusimicrobiota bacterium]
MNKRARVVIPVVLAGLIGALVWKIVHRPAFLYAGTVEATESDLSARIPSVIAGYQVNESDAVTAGQVLVRMTCEDQALEADITGKDFRRVEKLWRAGSASQEVYDRSRYKRDTAALEKSWCDVRSPINGMVLEKYHELGERVNPGTQLLRVADLSEVYAYIYVPQPVLARLKLGMVVTGILPELAGRSFPGQIRHIRQDAEFTPKNVQTEEERTRLVFGVKVYFQNPDLILKPGMTIEVGLPRA